MPDVLLGRIAIAAAALILSSCSEKPPAPLDLAGSWRATLTLPGGELPFGLVFTRDNDRWRAELINGEDRVGVDEVELQGSALRLRMPGFENHLDARRDGDGLVGELTMIKRGGKEQIIPFAAQRSSWFSFSDADTASGTAPAAELSGRWAVTFVDDGKESPAVGEFRQRGREVAGTFLTPTGDHRYLSGQIIDNTLKLAKFDGGHVFLYHAAIGADGTLQGQFWSGTAHREQFRARKDPQATLVGAYETTQMRSGQKRLNFRFPDLDGELVASSDPRFAGKVLIVALAGSWCPNCHDEAAFLAPLYRRYRDQGLEVVSLMFEQFGDLTRAVEATRRFRDRYEIQYTTLIAGTSDKQDASLRLPELNGVFAFPTTVFIDRRGEVRRIHSGFSGPATGEHYQQLTAEFTASVEELLAEHPAD